MTTPLRIPLRGLSPAARLDWGAWLLTVGVFLVAQFWLLLGPHPFDPAKYFQTGVDFPDVPADLWTLRIGLVAPVVMAVHMIGPTEAALYAVPLAAGVLLVTAVYGTMLALFRDRVLAVAAALLAALNTDFLLNSSFLFPDTVGTATFAAGFLFLVLGGLARERSARASAIAVVLAGFFFGWTYLIRDFSPILLPTVVAAAVLLRYPWRRLGLLAGAAACTAALELIYGAVMYGQPLVHVHALLEHRNAAFTEQRAITIATVQEHTQNLGGALLILPRLILAWNTGWLLLILAPLFVVALLVLRNRQLWVIAAWGIGFWLIMVGLALGELPSGRWIINTTNVRYWYPVYPALAMGGTAGLWLLVRRFAPERRGLLFARLAVVALALVILLPGFAEFRRCTPENVWRNDPIARWNELRSWLGSSEAAGYDRILTDHVTGRMLDPAFLHETVGDRVWDGHVRLWPRKGTRIEPVQNIDRSLILVYARRFAGVQDGQAKLDALDSTWSPVFVSSDRTMVLLARNPVPSELTAGELEPWWHSPPSSESQPGGCGLHPFF
jgi:hypothetical protein